MTRCKTKVGSETWCKPIFSRCCSSNNIWQHIGIIPSSLSGLTLLYRVSILQGVLIHHANHFGFPTYPTNKHGSLCDFLVNPNTRFNNIAMFWIRKGSVVGELYIFRVKFFISDVSLLLASLDSTPTESLHEHKHCSTANKPRQYPGGVVFFTYLRKNPFSSFSFIYIFK